MPCPVCKTSFVIAVPGRERQKKISSLLVKCPAQLCDELDKKEEKDFDVASINDVASIYDAAQPKCPSATVTPLYADFEMKELVEDQACVVPLSRRTNMHAEPNSAEQNPAKMCDWVGQLRQVDHHLRLAHRGDKRWIKDSPPPEPDRMHQVQECSVTGLQRFFLFLVVITLIAIVVEARILFCEPGPENKIPINYFNSMPAPQ